MRNFIENACHCASQGVSVHFSWCHPSLCLKIPKELCTFSMQVSLKGGLLADVVLQLGTLLIPCFACLIQFLILQISV